MISICKEAAGAGKGKQSAQRTKAQRASERRDKNKPLTPALSPSEGERENCRQRLCIGIVINSLELRFQLMVKPPVRV